MAKWTLATALSLLMVAHSVSAQQPALPHGLKLERVALLMRHGVRAPTKGEPVAASQPWPAWAVDVAHMTPHGESAIRLIAAFDRANWRAAGLLPANGCAPVRVIADNGQRTTLTGRIYADVLAGGCPAGTVTGWPGDVDILFAPIGTAGVTYDARIADRAAHAMAGSGGVAGEERRHEAQIGLLGRIICTPYSVDCDVARTPSRLAPAERDKRPRMTGALAHASGAAQAMMLQYMDGWPMEKVGWGRVTPADFAKLSALRSSVFRIVARPPYVARANSARLGPLMADALGGAGAPRVTAVIGHDTNIASLAGLLGLHWRVPGLADDDPVPGGAIVFEKLVDAKGRGYVRALYRSQTLEQIRRLTPLTISAPYVHVMPMKGCRARNVRGLCSASQFREALLRRN